MFTTGEIVGLAEWIIDDTCLVPSYFCVGLQVWTQDKEIRNIYILVGSGQFDDFFLLIWFTPVT